MRWLVMTFGLLVSPSLSLHAGAQVGGDSTAAEVRDSLMQGKPDLMNLGVGLSGDTLLPGRQETKSPGLAMLLSAVVPGAGQAYNESYWKVPIALGLGVYFTSQWLHYNRLTRDARDQYDESLVTTPGGDPRVLRLREFYKDQRDTYTWYFLIFYLVNVTDAYVDASLYNFSISDDLTLRVMPFPAGGLTVRLDF